LPCVSWVPWVTVSWSASHHRALGCVVADADDRGVVAPVGVGLLLVVAGVQVNQVPGTVGGELVVGGGERGAGHGNDCVGASSGQCGSFAVGLRPGLWREMVDGGEDFHAHRGGKGDGERDGAVVVVAHVQPAFCPLNVVAGVVVGWQCPSVAGHDAFDLGGGAREGDVDEAGFVGGLDDAGDGAHFRIRESTELHLLRDQR